MQRNGIRLQQAERKLDEIVTLSASSEIPRSRERERMSAGQVRAVGEKQFNAQRAG
jgi:hypothetical protein